MQFDFNQLNQAGQLDQVLSKLPYPLNKEDVVERAQQEGANPKAVEAMQQALPDGEYASAEQVKKGLQRGIQQFH